MEIYIKSVVLKRFLNKSANWQIRGTVAGVRVFESAETSSREKAEQVRKKRAEEIRNKLL